MRSIDLALVLAAVGTGVVEGCGSIAGRGDPPGNCSPPDGGNGCSCPGASVIALGCAEMFVCRSDSTWQPYDGSCLNPTSEAAAAPGCTASGCTGSTPSCCAEPAFDDAGAFVIVRSCQPSCPVSHYTQICGSNADCPAGYACVANPLYMGASFQGICTEASGDGGSDAPAE